ncbi:MAG: c-type cytochrome domain-containing protein, partial [Verrucomicrobiales bacterium]
NEPHQERGRLRKPKGGLRLDAARGILQGGGEGDAVVPGDPEGSLLYVLVGLPHDDDDVMPPDGDGEPLDEAELKIVRTWIEEGATFGGWVGNEKGLASAVAPEASTSEPSAASLLAAQVKGASEEVLTAVAATGALISQVAIGNPLLRVEYISEESKIGDEQVATIAPLAGNVTELDLSETAVSDGGLVMLSDFSKLTYLDLHDTRIGDETIEAMKNLAHLEYLNLYGTNVTDASLPMIAKFRKLKAVYLWKTEISEEGAAKLKKALPDAKINL